MPAALLSAQFTDQELILRKQARTAARHTVPDPAATARVLALAICEVEAGRPGGECHHSGGGH